MNHLVVVVPALFVIAFLYASVGHGGASGYLAILALAGMESATIRPIALILNLLVSAVALLRFVRHGHFSWSILLPFAVTAVPCAFIAGRFWSLDARYYRIALGITLIFAAWRLLISTSNTADQIKKIPLLPALAIGGVIGLVSGLIGVGGGIFLSPILILCYWATPRQTAAVSAAFILFSSIAGLAGLGLQSGGFHLDVRQVALYAVAAVAGGFVGSSLGASRFDPLALRRVLAVVLIVAAVKLTL